MAGITPCHFEVLEPLGSGGRVESYRAVGPELGKQP